MCWFFCFCFFLSPGGHNFRCLSFPGIYVCSFTGHSFLPWGSKADPPMAGDALFKMLHVLLQSSFTVQWVSTPKRFRGTGASRGSDPTVEVRSPLYDPTCHYEGRTGVHQASLEIKILSQISSKFLKSRAPCPAPHMPAILPSFPGPQACRKSSAVSCPRQGSWKWERYGWLLSESRCWEAKLVFACFGIGIRGQTAFRPRHVIVKLHFQRNWVGFYWRTFPPSFFKNCSWQTGFWNVSCSWGTRKLPSQVYLYFKLTSL